MKKRGDSRQLTLDLQPPGESIRTRQAPAHVVPFVDGATLEVRRDAVRRVISAGIFVPPVNLRSR